MAKRSVRHLRIFGIGALVLIGSGILWGANYFVQKKQKAQLDEARKTAMVDFFASFSQNGLIPIVRPASHAVGSVYDAKDGNWIDRATNCFPKLQIPQSVASSLPNVSFSEIRRGEAGLGIEKLISGSLKPESIQSISIEFTNVEMRGVSQRDLIDTYVQGSCSELQQIFESVNSGTAPTAVLSTLFVIRELYTAKRKLVIKIANKRDAEEAASIASKDLKAHVEDHASGQFSLILENDEPLPVAAKPAFLPIPLGVTLGNGPALEPQTVWMPFDLQLDPGTVEIFRSLVMPGLEGSTQSRR